MSSDLCTFDVPFRRHSSTNMVSYDGITDFLLFSDPYPFSSSFFSPPPSTHLENQSEIFSASEQSRVKSEECQIGADYTNDESASKLMQRSYSCNSFDGKPGFFLHRDTFKDSANCEWHSLSSPENSFFTGQIRRACSARDLQNMKSRHNSQRESPLLEEANFKVGRYSPEERKEKISRYRAKRSQRKFNKTVKYACRKTLADNRTRIRGRFARNDETSEIPQPPCSTTTEEHEDEFWVEFMEGLSDELLR